MQKLNFWPFSAMGQGSSHYSDSEKELIRQQLKASNERAKEAAAKRGYTRHPRMAAKAGG
jgi:hypothetical protein